MMRNPSIVVHNTDKLLEAFADYDTRVERGETPDIDAIAWEHKINGIYFRRELQERDNE